MTTDTPTPRTDALLNKLRDLTADDSGECWTADDVMAFLKHARDLERELNEAKLARDIQGKVAVDLIAERDQWKQMAEEYEQLFIL